MKLLADLRAAKLGKEQQSIIVDKIFKHLLTLLENPATSYLKAKTCLLLLAFLTNFLAPSKVTIIETLRSLQGPVSSAIVARKEEVSDSLMLAALSVVHLVDVHDYHLAYVDRYSHISTEKAVALLAGDQSSVALDIRIELDTVSSKVIQVRNETSVNDLISTAADDKLRSLFREVNQQEGAFWMYIAVKDKDEDIPLLASSRMVTVKHLLTWYKSIYGNAEVQLTIRRRSFCGRSLFSIDKLINSEVNLNYNHTLHGFFDKGYFNRFLKEDKLIEAVALAYYIKNRGEETASNQKSAETRLHDLQLMLNQDMAKLFDAAEWMRRVTAVINKNIAIKKQSDLLLKRKFLSLFKDSKFFCSQVYGFKVYKSKLDDIPASGRVCVNLTGIFIFDDLNFKLPRLSILINDILEFEQKGPRLKLKFILNKSVRTIFLIIKSSKQFCEDVAASMVLGLRENRYYVYSYLYIIRMLPSGITASQRAAIEYLHGLRLAKCNEYLSSQGDNILSFADLPFTSAYQATIPREHPSSERFYFPFKQSDLSRDQPAKKSKAMIPQLTTALTHSATSSPMKQAVKSDRIHPKRASKVRFDADEDSDHDSDGGRPQEAGLPNINIDPSLLALTKRR